LVAAPPARSQSLDAIKKEQGKLEQKRKKLVEEIALTQKRISEVQSRRSGSLVELTALKKQLRSREELISTIRKQVDESDRGIRATESQIKALEKDITRLKELYAKMIYNSYVHHTPKNNLLFVFSSGSFNDALRRVEYVKAYSSFRREQAELIRHSREEMQAHLRHLEVARKEKEELLSAELRNRAELNGAKETITRKINDFKKEEAKYATEIKAKEKEQAQLNDRIKTLIKDAIKEQERLNKLAAAPSKSSTSSSAANTPALASTREAQQLAAQFASNKGKLPWPVEKGYVTSQFGKRYLPEAKMTVENNGIDIATERGAKVRAIFNGEVTNTFYSPVFKYGVLISHGNYFTVYTGLHQVSVKEGDKVATKQTIGTAHTREDTNATEVHLEIWQGTTVLNPSLYIFQ
jgi:septal ring factor EnvC (AmiA/AmiB activator)